jgi:hypothetical protein
MISDLCGLVLVPLKGIVKAGLGIYSRGGPLAGAAS